ncbi:MAG: hypothetical protein H7235_06480 [Bdellovibrionaceae bacterium]|nr:hypothetical protein [Pseudobdellovibrionaceae bacterium]
MLISKHILFVTLALILFATQAFAASYARLATVYMSEDNGGDTHSRLLLDLGGGWIANNGLTLGFLYASEKNTISNGSSYDRTSFGPNIGYASKKEEGWYVIGTYLMSSTTTTGLKGKGNQIDVGYKFQINKVSFAPQLSRKQFTYTTQNGNDLSSNYSEGRIDPYFVMWIDF